MNHEDRNRTGIITRDAGGLTRWGISSRYNPGVDVEHLTLEGAADIYWNVYWNPYHLDKVIFTRVSSKIADMIVNPGQTSIKIIQRLVDVKPDGIIGPMTINRINQCNPDVLLESMCNAQAVYYRKHDFNNTAFKGLLVRALDKPMDNQDV
jgi:lysozyme family protein